MPRIQLIRGFVHTMTMTDLSVGGQERLARVSFTAGRVLRWKLIPQAVKSALCPRCSCRQILEGCPPNVTAARLCFLRVGKFGGTAHMLPSRLRPASAFCRAGADQVAFHAPAGRERSVSCLSARLFGLSSCCDGIVTLTLDGRRGTKATRCRADHEAWRAQFSCRQILNASVRAVR